MRAWGFAIASLFIASCFTSATETCGDTLCPPGTRCSPDGASCVLQAQVDACDGQPDGTSCTFGNANGGCVGGVCMSSGCGDGRRDPSEECEDTDLAGHTCKDLGYYRGTLACTKLCTFDTTQCAGKCGDGVLDNEEQCDGALLAGADCQSVGYYLPDGLACNSACVYDRSACTGGTCGDGIKNGPEPCDGPGPTGVTCQDLGYHAGATVTCTTNCELDASQCSETCGDGMKNGPEDCDGMDLGGLQCNDLGYYTGTLACHPYCSFNTSGCSGKCGDGMVTGPEQCDGGVGTHTCTERGFSHPAGLACTLCTFDTTECLGVCGDGYLESPEICDAPSFGGRTCIDSGFDAGRLGCSAVCGETHDDCGTLDWEPVGRDANATWSTGSVAFFVGPGLQATRYDGTTWQTWTVDSGVGVGLTAVWGTSATNVWAVGNQDGVYHFDGTSWTKNTTLTASLYGVWTIGSDVFVCGSNGLLAHFDGATWTTTTIVNDSFYVVGGSSATDVYAGGMNSLQHWNGTAWSKVPLGADLASSYHGVYASAANDVYVASSSGVIWHYNGTAWAPHASPVNLGYGHGYQFMSGTSANDVWAGGFAPTVLQHWNGSTWTSLRGPKDGAVTGLSELGTSTFAISSASLYRSRGTFRRVTPTAPAAGFGSVWASSPSDVHLGLFQSDEIHVAASGWDTRVVAPDDYIEGMWGSAPSDIWAIGQYSIYHYNGTAWTTAVVGTFSNQIFAITGTSASNVWAVGSGSTWHFDGTSWTSAALIGSLDAAWAVGSEVFAVGNPGTIKHYTGTTWKVMTSGTTNVLWGVWGTTNANVYAVGDNGTILHYDGTSWTAQASGVTSTIAAVWGTSASNLYAATRGGEILHSNGTTWTTIQSYPGAALRAIGGSGASDIWVVGDDQPGAASALGVAHAYHYDGTTWTQLLPFTAQLDAVFGMGAGALAVGASGVGLRYDGELWLPVPTGTTKELHALWGPSASDVTAVGAAGTMRHWDGATWSTVTSGTSADLYAIWNGYAVGAAGTVLHGSGASWSPMASNTTNDLFGVWGSSASDVYAVGRAGTIDHYNGASWATVSSGTKKDLYAVSGSSASNVMAVGQQGVVTRWNGTLWTASWTGVASTLTSVAVNGIADALAGGATGHVEFFDGAHWTTLAWPFAASIEGMASTGASTMFVGTAGSIDGLLRPITCAGTDVCGDRWDNDCDGVADASDSDCAPPPAENCANGLDDDRDGLTDCEDPDCVGATYCVRGGACQARTVIQCGDTLSGTTSSLAKLDDYPCSARGEAGGEANFRITLAAPKMVTATLTTAADLDVIAVGAGASLGCEPWTECYASGTGAVTFAAPSGTSFLIVDSPTATSAPFSLTVTCN